MMNRTRIVFFVILALYVAVIAIALASNVAGAPFLRTLFIGSTVFSAGVVLLDFLGIFGEHHGDTTGDVTAGHIGADMSGGHAAGEGGAHFGGDHGAAVHAPIVDAAGHGTANHSHADDASASQQQASPAPILSVLTYLRLFVYFCLGFGPVGWIALVTGRTALISLLMAAAVGVLAVFLAQAFFSFQRHDTDSQLQSRELVGQRATVIVPLDAKTMGKVRVQVGLMVTEQYALASRLDAAFAIGDEVVIVSVTDECVYVR